MKITVDRVIQQDSGALVFTITAIDPTIAYFTDTEKELMDVLDATKDACQSIMENDCCDNGLEFVITSKIHDIKSDVFDRVMERLKFNIENDLRPKFRPICQEIYNWIFDAQSGVLKEWMQEFDPQRTKYYFDNDQVAAKGPDIPQASEHEDEDDEDNE